MDDRNLLRKLKSRISLHGALNWLDLKWLRKATPKRPPYKLVTTGFSSSDQLHTLTNDRINGLLEGVGEDMREFTSVISRVKVILQDMERTSVDVPFMLIKDL